MNIPASKTKEIIRVLLIDDHPVILDGYGRLLDKTSGIKVVAKASNGETACELYQKHLPDVAILDLNMPGIGGLETLRRIRAKNPGARILVFTMHDNPTMIQRVMEAGAMGYITKQSGVGPMVDAVRQVADGKLFIDIKHIPDLMNWRTNPPNDPIRTLSEREFQLFQLLAEGHSVMEIAEILSISPKTAGVHHTNIMKKLDVHNTVQLVRLAIQQGIIQP
jgi:two-component system invasion response regulator UvrY